MINNSYAISNKNNITVGSCFDYPPLTYISNGSYVGSDIKIIQDFAKDNNMTIHFIKTSWPKLEEDLKNNVFDVAVGGINDTSSRRKKFLLSDNIGSSRKVALIRCEDINRFKTLAAIDQSSIKVVENKGGANQDFAFNTLKKAQITVVKNNQLPFDYLLNKQADVMFTDNIEAFYKHNTQPKLCEANLDKEFPVSFKVFLFAKNSSGKKLQKQFNVWWKNKLSNK